QRGERLIVGGALVEVPRVGGLRHDETLKTGLEVQPRACGTKEALSAVDRTCCRLATYNQDAANGLIWQWMNVRPIPRRGSAIGTSGKKLRQGAMGKASSEPWLGAAHLPPRRFGRG